jgi:hypothetical protein
MTFRVGAVPVFKYLEGRDVDEVGYTLRTASLMTDPEFYFDERNPSDYTLFGIRYLILPPAHPPPVRAHLMICTGSYCLWDIANSGYLHAGRIVGTLVADRTNVGIRSLALLRLPLADQKAYLRLSLGAAPRSATHPAPGLTPSSTSRVAGQAIGLEYGSARALVRMPRGGGVVVLSASFDSGWTGRVDDRPANVFPVAPALIAASVPAGIHTVTFRYVGFSYYLPLLLLGGLSLACLAIVDRKRRKSQCRRCDAGLQLTMAGQAEIQRADDQPVAVGPATQGMPEGRAEDANGGKLVGAARGRD